MKYVEFPAGEKYETLYKRYFEKGVEYVGMHAVSGSALDLCGGTGRLSKYLREKGHDVTYLDRCEQMCLLDASYPKIISTVEDFANSDLVFDNILCMQAINYWFHTVDISAFANRVNKRFVFNTFINRPKTEKTVREYVIDGLSFKEIYHMDGETVCHCQECYCDNILVDSHYTEFLYIPVETFIEKLKPYFNVNVIRNKGSALFICDKKMS